MNVSSVYKIFKYDLLGLLGLHENEAALVKGYIRILLPAEYSFVRRVMDRK